MRDDRIDAVAQRRDVLGMDDRAQEHQKGDEGPKKLWKLVHYTKIRTERGIVLQPIRGFGIIVSECLLSGPSKLRDSDGIGVRVWDWARFVGETVS